MNNLSQSSFSVDEKLWERGSFPFGSAIASEYEILLHIFFQSVLFYFV
jgi:hypothetical protein